MSKPRLGLHDLTDQQVIDLATLVSGRLEEEAAKFADPAPAPATLAAAAAALTTLMQQRTALAQQVTEKTLSIRAQRDALEDLLAQEADYVERVSEGDAALIALAGFDIAADTTAPVGPMPKVEGLAATSGDADGEVDLVWNPVKRGLRSYLVEQTAAAGGEGGWAFAKTETRSATTVSGLTSGQRYWFRVKAVGTSGPGPASEPVTKVAP